MKPRPTLYYNNGARYYVRKLGKRQQALASGAILQLTIDERYRHASAIYAALSRLEFLEIEREPGKWKGRGV